MTEEEFRAVESRAVGEFLDALTANYQLMYACKIGLHLCLPGLKKNAETSDPAKYQAARVEIELRQDFNTLKSQALISLCAAAEVFITDLVVNRLLHDNSLFKRPPWCDIKVTVGELAGLAPEDFGRFLVEAQKLKLNFESKAGVDRFEKLLGAVGLGGPVTKELNEQVFELFNVRNVLIHRRGIADQKLLDACPKAGFKLNEALVITDKHYDLYWQAVTFYGGLVMERLTPTKSSAPSRETASVGKSRSEGIA